MITKIQLLAMAAAVILFCTSNMYGQHQGSDVYWHTDPDLKTCSMVFIGVTYSFWLINTTVEYEISNVNTFSFMIALQTFKRK